MISLNLLLLSMNTKYCLLYIFCRLPSCNEKKTIFIFPPTLLPHPLLYMLFFCFYSILWRGVCCLSAVKLAVKTTSFESTFMVDNSSVNVFDFFIYTFTYHFTLSMILVSLIYRIPTDFRPQIQQMGSAFTLQSCCFPQGELHFLLFFCLLSRPLPIGFVWCLFNVGQPTLVWLNE